MPDDEAQTHQHQSSSLESPPDSLSTRPKNNGTVLYGVSASCDLANGGIASPGDHTATSQAGRTEDAPADDLDPRSPKRRKLSASGRGDDKDDDGEHDDDVLDIGAAAARALAMSLGQSPIPPEPSASPFVPQQNVAGQSQVSTQNPTRSSSLALPSRQMRIDNLSKLNDLALQLLVFLAKLNHLEIGEMLFGPPSARGSDYHALKQKFNAAKSMYVLNNSPFLMPQALDLCDGGQIDMIRRINLAVFMTSIFSGEIGLRIMDINFIDVFVPEGGRLLKPQGSIYLELKTHAFMAATRTASAMLNQVMLDLFPSDMDKYFLAKRPGAKGLAPSEQDFLNRLASRRDILYSVIRTNKLGTLPDTYRWNDFAREVSIYLTKHMENSLPSNKEVIEGQSQSQQTPLSSLSRTEPPFSLSSAPTLPLPQLELDEEDGQEMSLDSIERFVGQVARAAALSMGNNMDLGFLPPTTAALPLQTSDSTSAMHQLQPRLPNETAIPPRPDHPEGQAQFQHYSSNGTALSLDDNGLTIDETDRVVPHSSQTAPTQVLYERARQVTTNKALSSKKPAPPSHRRPWTTEEENALMTGLDQVKGPHWSQILAMYGPGGTINESLKDRNQVQLKDKARNLKLFFLKANIEVPYYLQAVTGDLKTRAPGQAEKKERERLLGEGEKAQADDSQANTEVAELELGELETHESEDATPNAYQAADEQAQDTTAADDEEPEFDMEAMIARAAASASRGLKGPPWGL